ncbi:hypothetical protein [Massilia scottii]|uniref:hypothetical protein n=1 Tax=Massilia scottii TaxID=3057166 RepID=UPI00279649C5|nr:hypothetical protein [Massilia sp. CCM 9029]MDQ1835206.1 hypothetical protein [Massilia sp. CCM 9029]
MDKNSIDALLLETKRRQRRKTDLSAFDARLKEMMDLNISLPVILTWLQEQDKTTTLPALRRYIRRQFGDDLYDDFLVRNGWQRTKKIGEKTIKKDSKSSTTRGKDPLAKSAENSLNKALSGNRTNPLRALEKKSESEFSGIPESKFEIDNS